MKSFSFSCLSFSLSHFASFAANVLWFLCQHQDQEEQRRKGGHVRKIRSLFFFFLLDVYKQLCELRLEIGSVSSASWMWKETP